MRAVSAIEILLLQPECTELKRASMAVQVDSGGDETSQLTRALLKGDEQAWYTFHDRYAHRLWRYLLVLLGGREDNAGEALQETFIRAARHMKPFATDAALWSWLTVLARSVVIDESRRVSRWRRFLDRFREQQSDSDLPSAEDAAVQLNQATLRELDRMPGPEAALLRRKYLDHASVKDIAAELGLSEKTVESRLTRARHRIREQLLHHLHHETESP